MANCLYCKKEIGDGVQFCPYCGKKQVIVYTQTFQRGNLSEDAFIAKINEWFATYPNVANVKGKFLLSSGVGLFVNKYCLDAFAIEYEVFGAANDNQYALVRLTESGITKTPSEVLLAKWKQKNPGAVVLNTNGGVHQRGKTGSLLLSSGFGAVNMTQLYVFFKFNRKKGTGQ